MVHGIKPILPLDLAEVTFLVPKLNSPVSHVDLIAIWACQLEKWDSNLAIIKDRVLKAHYASVAQFEKDNANLIKDYDFAPGSLVLVWNTRIENDLSRKTKPRYLRPLLVIQKNHNMVYILVELDGSVHKLPFAGFCLVPYYSHSCTIIPVTSVVDSDGIPLEDLGSNWLKIFNLMIHQGQSTSKSWGDVRELCSLYSDSFYFHSLFPLFLD